MTIATARRLELEGKTALVVGSGGGGIGTGVVMALAEAGADVIGVDQAASLLEESAELVSATGRRFTAHRADVRMRAELEEALARALSDGPVELLVNVAGGTLPESMAELDQASDEAYDDAVGRNFEYVFVTCRGFARATIDRGRGGAIVNASVSGLASARSIGLYGAAKAAVMALTRTMAVEWGRHGIRVNAVAPGGTRTPRLTGAAPQALVEAARWNPLGRVVEPGEVATAVVFLLSDLAAAITGQTLVVDCGASARSPFGGVEWGPEAVP